VFRVEDNGRHDLRVSDGNTAQPVTPTATPTPTVTPTAPVTSKFKVHLPFVSR
jgi:hypothetical protein